MKTSQELAMSIKETAKSKNITIGKMLSDCGLSVNTLSSMQSGGYFPRLEAINKIADYLNCSVDYLLGRTNETANSEKSNISDIYDIGNVGNNSNKVIGNNNNIGTNQNYEISSDEKEVINILRNLSNRERTKLLSKIYEWEEELKKKTD